MALKATPILDPVDQPHKDR